MDKSIQEMGMSNKVNLCGSCCHEYPACAGDNIIWGDGIGADNTCACSEYKALTCHEWHKQQ